LGINELAGAGLEALPQASPTSHQLFEPSASQKEVAANLGKTRNIRLFCHLAANLGFAKRPNWNAI
jgi:hypothetical protein